MIIDKRKLDLALADNQMNVIDLAKASGVCRNTIEGIRSGRRQNATTMTVGKIAAALGVKAIDIIE